MEDGTLKEPGGLVLDAFQGNIDKKVKANNANHPLLKWLMMDGGITPKAQPLDVPINKVFKSAPQWMNSQWSTAQWSKRSGSLKRSRNNPLKILLMSTSRGWDFGVIPPSIMIHLSNGWFAL